MKLKQIILSKYFYLIQNAILYQMLNLGLRNFNPIKCTFHWLQHLQSLNMFCKVLTLHLEHALLGFNIYNLTFGDKIIVILRFHIWNQLPKTLKAK